jgi:ketosteroid isomerase-like protein
LEALRSPHLDSPKFSKFGPRITERQDVKSTNETESEHVLSISDASFDLEDIKIDLFGDIAVTTFYNNYSFIKNNNRVQGKGRVTLVFLNTEEGWKIVHEHSSPFNQ